MEVQHQGDKEETFIQTRRRGGDRQLRRRGHVARLQMGNVVVPHSHADKLGRKTEEQDRPHNPEFQCEKRKPQSLCL